MLYLHFICLISCSQYRFCLLEYINNNVTVEKTILSLEYFTIPNVLFCLAFQNCMYDRFRHRCLLFIPFVVWRIKQTRLVQQRFYQCVSSSSSRTCKTGAMLLLCVIQIDHWMQFLDVYVLVWYMRLNILKWRTKSRCVQNGGFLPSYLPKCNLFSLFAIIHVLSHQWIWWMHE